MRLVPGLTKGGKDKLSVASVLDPGGLQCVVGQEVELAWGAVVLVSANKKSVLVNVYI